MFFGRRDTGVPVGTARLRINTTPTAATPEQFWQVDVRDKCEPLEYLRESNQVMLFYVEGIYWAEVQVQEVRVTLTLIDLCGHRTPLIKVGKIDVYRLSTVP